MYATWSSKQPEVTILKVKTSSSSYFCTDHRKFRLTHYCKDEDTLCCKQCLASSYLSCKDVMLISEASEGFKRSKVFADYKSKINELTDTLQALFEVETNFRNIGEDENGNGDKASCDEEVVKESSSQSEDIQLETYASENDVGAEAVFDDCKYLACIENLIQRVNEQTEICNFVEKYGTEEQAFLTMYVSRRTIDEIEFELNHNQDASKISPVNSPAHLDHEKENHKMSDSTISQEDKSNDNITLQNEEENISKSSGTNSKNTSHSDNIDKLSPLLNRSKKYLENREPVEIHHQIRSFDYQYDIDFGYSFIASIYGLTCTDKNMLLLCDSSNLRVLVCDENDNFVYQISTRYEPWDIITIPGTQLAVTSSANDDHVLQYIDLKKKSTTKETKLKDSEQGGIAVGRKNLFVGCQNVLQMLDLKGSRRRVIAEVTEKICHVLVSGNGTITFVHGQYVTCISPGGTLVFTYSSPDLQAPGKPCRDVFGNIYIPDLYSNNIVKITEDGTYSETILNEKDGIHFPTAIEFGHHYSRLYVVNNGGSSVKVYSVER